MEKKNMVLLTVIAVATLLVAVVGATFAYFTATIQDNRTGNDTEKGQASIKAAESVGKLIIKQSKDGFGGFNRENILPGHKELIQISVQADENNTADTYFDIVYTGTNTFPQNAIKFHIYESLEDLGNEVSAENAFVCKTISESETGSGGTESKLYEDCTLNSKIAIEGEAHEIKAVTPENYKDTNDSQSTSTKLNGDLPFVITGSSLSKTVYYYVVVEYVNNPSDGQNDEMNAELNGKITVEMAAKNSGAIADDETHLTTKDTP